MEVIRGIEFFNRSVPHAVLTIGNFDGVHLGHQEIIRLAKQKAMAREGTCIAYTFRPHPQISLKPGTRLPLLLTYDEKLEILASTGVDITIEEPFSREFSSIEPDLFFRDVVLGRLKAEVIVVGHDFAFGKGRHGHLEALESFCKNAGVELIVVSPQGLQGEVVSSSRIRQCLLSGRVDLASHYLGRPFFYRGVVVKGEGRGRKLGFPTANLKLEDKLTLPFGVYATRAVFGNSSFPSVTNIGVRPTFRQEDLAKQTHQDLKELPALVETHILDRTLDLYGSQLEVQFISRLRDEKKFAGVEQLKVQISSDIESARKLL